MEVVQTSSGLMAVPDRMRRPTDFLIQGNLRKRMNRQIKRIKRFSTAARELRRIRLSKKIEKQLVKNFCSSKFGKSENINVAVVGAGLEKNLSPFFSHISSPKAHILHLDWSKEISGSNVRNITMLGNLGIVTPPNLTLLIERPEP